MSIAGKLKRLIKDAVLGCWLPCTYRWAARFPVKQGSVLFVEAKEDGIPDSFKILYERLLHLDGCCVELASLQQQSSSYARYCLNCADMVKRAACAEVIVLNDASDVISCLPLRRESRVVQLWHACGAFKKWGMSTADLKFGGSREEKKKHPFYDNLSLVTVSSPEVIWAYSEAMDIGGSLDIIKPLGVSRTDIFFDPSFVQSARNQVESVVPESIGKKVLLYAPTFRGRVKHAEGPSALDIKGLQTAFSNDYVLLVKHHPFVKQRPAISEDCDSFAFDVSDRLSIDTLLCVADICISDYSSLVFEYSLFGRPMVFFAFDLDDYCDWRGFYYDYDDLTPGPVFRDSESVIDYIRHIDERFDRKKVEVFRDRFMGSCDGHATDRIIDFMFGA